MSYVAPIPVLHWRSDIWPGNQGATTPLGTAFGDVSLWTPFPTLPDGTSRIISWSTRRGRRSITERMGPGTMTLVLDNSDGMLDPNKTGSHTYGVLPGALVGLYLVNPSTGSTSPRFHGFLDSPWVAGHSHDVSTVTITVTDYYGYAAYLDSPGSAWNMHNGSFGGTRMWSEHLLWLRGLINASAANSTINASVWNFGTTGTDGRLTGTSGVFAQGPISATNVNSVSMSPNAVIYVPGVPSVPGLSALKHWAGLVVAPIDKPGAAMNMVVSRDLSNQRKQWSIEMNTDGSISARVYDASESKIGEVTRSFDFTTVNGATVGAVWDYSAKRITLRAAGTTTSATWSGTAASNAGRVQLESSWNTGFRWAELVVGDGNTPTFEDDGGVSLIAGQYQVLPFDAPPVTCAPGGGPRPSDWPTIPGSVSTYSPTQAYLEALGNAVGGAVYCDRRGWIVWRAGDDLGRWPASRGTNNAVTDGVYQVSAVISDRADDVGTRTINGRSYTWPLIRWSGDGLTGPDSERVENWIEVGLATFADPESWRRYGRRESSLDGVPTVTTTTGPAAKQAAARLSQRKTPTRAAPSVTITPWGDQAATDWVVDELDLESRVLFTQSRVREGAGVVTDLPLRVQAEDWDWSDGGTNWTVTLTLDEPIPNK